MADVNRTPSRDQINQLAQAQSNSAKLAQRELGRVWAEALEELPPERQRDALLELVPALIDKYSDLSSTAAAQWYQQVRDKWFSDDFQAQAPARANDDLSKLIRAKAGVLFGDDADPMQMLRFLNGVIDKGVKQGGRDAIRYNAKRDPRKPRYARVPAGAKTCAFCAMLASRGWVYASAETAGALNKYHGDCDCEIVPSWDKGKPKVEGYDPDALYKDYEKAREQAGENPTTEEILAAMRRQRGKYTDGNLERVIVPKGWVQPHAPNEERLLSMKGNTGVTDAEWYRRQERVGVSHSVDTLYPHEIVFLERFIPLGNQADWIPKSKTGESTNDFHWINRGVEAELKSLSGFKYSSAANRIADAVDRAVPHGVVKDIFVLDYGDSNVPGKLIYQLGLYNQRRASSHIKELWLMDGDGLHEITLK